MEFIKLFEGAGTVSTLLNLSLVSILGVLLGKLSIGKIKLGIAGVLFAGLLAGHIGAQFDHEVLHFVKEFGLILFVYSIGIEIGPRFISSFRSSGFKLNILAASIVVSGFLITLVIKSVFNIDTPVAVGMLCGAVTNTPSLGAAQSLISEQFANGSALAKNTGMAYAIAYPFGIIGIILAMFLIRYIFKIKVNNEINLYKKEADGKSIQAQAIHICITNPNLENKTLTFLKKSLENDFVFSRIARNGVFLVPENNLVLKKSDVVYGLASPEQFPHLELTVGKVEPTETFQRSEPMAMRHIIVTNRKIAGRTIKEINLSGLFPASITRIFRGESEIIAIQNTTVEFGDTVRVVGAREKMDEIAGFLGNSIRELSHPNLIPLFLGILLGVLLGSIPLFIPGLPTPAKLGLAGGPLIVSLLLGHKGRIGKFDFYMTPGANRYIRELGIILFLACVGIGSGKHFWVTVTDGGLRLMALSALITFVPLVLTGVIARFLKLNYLTICGLLSGSMTDPPALEFANSIAPGQAQANAYAMVYPLTMFLRILLAQVFVLIYV
ncbi:MAG: putative transporter [Bacteroidales bacterium]|nr:putative transporter [Bacteroidales bacterium]MBN2819718.1 putative transporter [Bacteroidales bacterium]